MRKIPVFFGCSKEVVPTIIYAVSQRNISSPTTTLEISSTGKQFFVSHLVPFSLWKPVCLVKRKRQANLGLIQHRKRWWCLRDSLLQTKINSEERCFILMIHMGQNQKTVKEPGQPVSSSSFTQGFRVFICGLS